MKTIYQTLMFSLVLAISTGVANAAPIPNLCYTTLEGGQFCTNDNVGKVQVLVYNAGWCPPCNQEIAELSAGYPEFADKPVVVASLSAEGFSKRSQPDQAFLAEWKKKFNVPFVVAGKHKDFGRALGSTGTIPFTVIVDKQGNIVKKGSMSAGTVYNTIREMLK